MNRLVVVLTCPPPDFYWQPIFRIRLIFLNSALVALQVHLSEFQFELEFEHHYLSVPFLGPRVCLSIQPASSLFPSQAPHFFFPIALILPLPFREPAGIAQLVWRARRLPLSFPPRVPSFLNFYLHSHSRILNQNLLHLMIMVIILFLVPHSDLYILL